MISFIGALPLGIHNSTAFQIAVAVVIVELIVVRLTLMYLNKIKFNNKIFMYVLPLAIV